MLTLLALGLMLLAFFVVLTSTASFDQRRMREVVMSVQSTFVPAREEIKDKPAVIDDGVLRAAVGALRAAVSEIFVGILPVDNSAPSKTAMTPDRVEIDVPMEIFFADHEAVLYPLPILEKLVALVNAPPAGYRMELVVRSAGETTAAALEQARIAALADGLVRRGLPLAALSVGVLQDAAGANTRERALRFTFLLLETDDDLAAVRMMSGGKGTP
ncbi:MAG: hypothetical protein K2P94_17260 [Rhodospirillaceae bacterium]|nr:hypothetical protein [Rhodospirillaceae bacterium]